MIMTAREQNETDRILGLFFHQFYVGVDLHFSGVVFPLRSVSFPVLLCCKLDPVQQTQRIFCDTLGWLFTGWTSGAKFSSSFFSLPSRTSSEKTDSNWFMDWLCLVIWTKVGSKGGAVVRALASHQCGPGSNPGVDAMWWVEYPRGFSPGTPVFPSP